MAFGSDGVRAALAGARGGGSAGGPFVGVLAGTVADLGMGDAEATGLVLGGGRVGGRGGGIRGGLAESD